MAPSHIEIVIECTVPVWLYCIFVCSTSTSIGTLLVPVAMYFYLCTYCTSTVSYIIHLLLIVVDAQPLIFFSLPSSLGSSSSFSLPLVVN